MPKIEELEQLPISLLPENWPLAVKLAWQDNTNTTNITSETLNLTVSETELVKQTQQSQASQLTLLSQDVQAQRSEVNDAKQQAQNALTTANAIKGDVITAKDDASEAKKNAASALAEANTVKADVLSAQIDASNAAKSASDASIAAKSASNAANTNTKGVANNLAEIAALKEAIKNVGSGFPGTDYVVESHEDDFGFYRVYASGYIEQGGIIKAYNVTTVGGIYPFYKPFVKNGMVIVGGNTNPSLNTKADVGNALGNQSLTHMRIYLRSYTGVRLASNIHQFVRWFAAGQGAVPPKAPDTPYTPTELEKEIKANKSAITQLEEKIKNGSGFPGTDYVVESTIHKNGFCRVYASGFCEQGGYVYGDNMVGTYPHGAEYDFYRPFTETDSVIIVGENTNATSSIRSNVSLSAYASQRKNRFRVLLVDGVNVRRDNVKSGTYWHASGMTAKPTIPPTPVTPNPQAVDYIVEQKREADGRWYRKYASGYIEQGGKGKNIAGQDYTTFDYLIPFTEPDSLVFLCDLNDATLQGYVTRGPDAPPNDKTKIKIAIRYADGSIHTSVAIEVTWKVEGY